MKGTKYVWVGKKPLRVGGDTGREPIQGCKQKWEKEADEELWIELIKGSSEDYYAKNETQVGGNLIKGELVLKNFLAAKCTQQKNCALNIEAVEVLLEVCFLKELLIFHLFYTSHEIKVSLQTMPVCPDFAGDLFKVSELSDTSFIEETLKYNRGFFTDNCKFPPPPVFTRSASFLPFSGCHSPGTMAEDTVVQSRGAGDLGSPSQHCAWLCLTFPSCE